MLNYTNLKSFLLAFLCCLSFCAGLEENSGETSLKTPRYQVSVTDLERKTHLVFDWNESRAKKLFQLFKQEHLKTRALWEKYQVMELPSDECSRYLLTVADIETDEYYGEVLLKHFPFVMGEHDEENDSYVTRDRDISEYFTIQDRRAIEQLIPEWTHPASAAWRDQFPATPTFTGAASQLFSACKANAKAYPIHIIAEGDFCYVCLADLDFFAKKHFLSREYAITQQSGKVTSHAEPQVLSWEDWRDDEGEFRAAAPPLLLLTKALESLMSAPEQQGWVMQQAGFIAIEIEGKTELRWGISLLRVGRAREERAEYRNFYYAGGVFVPRQDFENKFLFADCHELKEK